MYIHWTHHCGLKASESQRCPLVSSKFATISLSSNYKIRTTTHFITNFASETDMGSEPFGKVTPNCLLIDGDYPGRMSPDNIRVHFNMNKLFNPVLTFCASVSLFKITIYPVQPCHWCGYYRDLTGVRFDPIFRAGQNDSYRESRLVQVTTLNDSTSRMIFYHRKT